MHDEKEALEVWEGRTASTLERESQLDWPNSKALEAKLRRVLSHWESRTSWHIHCTIS